LAGGVTLNQGLARLALLIALIVELISELLILVQPFHRA
jgi:hypothetical protein